MSREAREARAGARGDRPGAPAWTGLGAVVGGLCASVVAVMWLAPWTLLERALEAEKAPDPAPLVGALLLVPLGAWVGALVEPLDWGVAWHAWPVASGAGALAGAAAGHLAASAVRCARTAARRTEDHSL